MMRSRLRFPYSLNIFWGYCSKYLNEKMKRFHSWPSEVNGGQRAGLLFQDISMSTSRVDRSAIRRLEEIFVFAFVFASFFSRVKLSYLDMGSVFHSHSI